MLLPTRGQRLCALMMASPALWRGAAYHEILPSEGKGHTFESCRVRPVRYRTGRSESKRRRMAELGLEGAREVCLVGETAPCGHPRQACSRHQQFDGPSQAPLQHEGVRRHPDRVAKGAGKMRAADTGDGAELDELKIAGQVRFNVVDDAAGLGRYENLGKPRLTGREAWRRTMRSSIACRIVSKYSCVTGIPRNEMAS
jgi:hypothetical protein